jgi:Flp pilus assembly protein TadD
MTADPQRPITVPASALPPDARATDASSVPEVLATAASLARAGRLHDAIATIQPHLQDSPACWPLASALADLLEATGATMDAIAALRGFVARSPRSAEGWHRLAGLLHRTGELPQAIDAAAAAAALRGDWPQALNRLGCLLEGIDPAQAAAVLERAVACAGPWNAPRLNLARLWRDHGRIADAIALLHDATTHAPADAAARIALAETRLQHGDYADGWRDYDWRFGQGGQVPAYPGTHAPVWDGRPLRGEIVMVWLEQGLGDQLQFCRYLPAIVAAGGRVWLQAPQVLQPLLASLGAVERFVDEGEVPAGFDLQIPLLSLPHALRASVPEIPRAPYLSADAAQLTAGTDTLRVGLVFASRADHPAATRRDCPLPLLRALSDLPQVALHSLQFGADASAAVQAQDWPIVDLAPVLGDFAQTATIVRAMDLVITVDTAMAHLCGALGHPVWTLLSTPCDWRWQCGRDDSPWYPSMRLYRQTTPGDWSSPLQRMRRDLIALTARRDAMPA